MIRTDDTVNKSLTEPGERIVWLRNQRNLNQASLAKIIGIKQPSLSALESGRSNQPSAHTLMKIAKVFGANPEWIVSGTGTPWERDNQLQSSEQELLLNLFKRLSPGRQHIVFAVTQALLSEADCA